MAIAFIGMAVNTCMEGSGRVDKSSMMGLLVMTTNCASPPVVSWGQICVASGKGMGNEKGYVSIGGNPNNG